MCMQCIKNKTLLIRTRSLSNAFRQLTVYVRMNIISGRKKLNSLISYCTAAMIPSSFSIILTKQWTFSVTRLFDSSPGLYYKWSIVTMRLSCTVVKTWRLKNNGVTTLTFRGHVTSLVTWPFDSWGSTSYGWSMVAQLWRYGASNIGRTDVDTKRKKKERKEKKKGGEERKEKEKWKGKGKEKEKRKGKKIGKRGKGKGERKGKGVRKENREGEGKVKGKVERRKGREREKEGKVEEEEKGEGEEKGKGERKVKRGKGREGKGGRKRA